MSSFPNDCHTNIDDLICLFDSVSVTRSVRICDYGLVLCQNGMISRQLDDYIIPASTVLDGVNPWACEIPKLYDTIYNRIYPENSIPGYQYELGILLNLIAFKESERYDIFMSAFRQSRFLVIPSAAFDDYESKIRATDIIPMPVNDSMYKLIVTGSF